MVSEVVWPQRTEEKFLNVVVLRAERVSRSKSVVNKPKLVVLRSRADFVELAKKGKKIQSARWLVINYKHNELGHLRCGWTIPKQVGKSVLRNRLKRWCREIVRSQIQKLPNVDINVFIRPVGGEFFGKITFQQFSEVLHGTLQKIK